jgi:hypothetical protein
VAHIQLYLASAPAGQLAHQLPPGLSTGSPLSGSDVRCAGSGQYKPPSWPSHYAVFSWRVVSPKTNPHPQPPPSKLTPTLASEPCGPCVSDPPPPRRPDKFCLLLGVICRRHFWAGAAALAARATRSTTARDSLRPKPWLSRRPMPCHGGRGQCQRNEGAMKRKVFS